MERKCNNFHTRDFEKNDLKGYYIQKGVEINVTAGIAPLAQQIAKVAQSGERKTEDLKVASSILAFRT